MAMNWKGGMGKGGKGGGKGGGNKGQPNWSIPGWRESLTEALGPFAGEDGDIEEVIKKVHNKAKNVSERYQKDERINQKLSATGCKAIIEEYVEAVLDSCRDSVFWEKTYFEKVVWTQPLLMMVLHTFSAAKIWNRVLKPQILEFINGGIIKWQEERRIQKHMEEAINVSGIKDEFKKKALQHIIKAYDDAHFTAPYGSTANDNPHVALLQDFVKGWMTSFVSRSRWDALADGLTDSSRESQVSTVSVLFQNLLDPNIACMPHQIAHEVTTANGSLPSSPWPFVDECSNEVFAEVLKEGGGAAKKRKVN